MTKPAARSPLKAWLVQACLVALAFGLLFFTIWQQREEIRGIFSRPLDPTLFVLAFAVYFTGLVLTFARWYGLVRAIDLPFRFRDACRLGFIGNVFNLVIPGAVGGDLIKAAYLSKEQHRSTQAIASMVIDRLVGLLGLFLLAGVAGIFVWGQATADAKRLIVVVWVAVGCGVTGLVLLFGQAASRWAPGLFEGHGKVALILRELRAASEAYRRRLYVVVAMIALSSFTHGLNVFAFYLVGKTLFPVGLPSLARHFLLVPLTLFTTAVPLPFGALGLSERVGKQLFELVGHPGGALAMMGFRVLMYGGGLVGSCVYLANLRQVRALTTEAEHLEAEFEHESDAGVVETLGHGQP